jgi:hypothetical protein
MSTRLERIIRIDQEIRAGRFPSASSLARQFEVSERTINPYHFSTRQDLQMMLLIGTLLRYMQRRLCNIWPDSINA